MQRNLIPKTGVRITVAAPWRACLLLAAALTLSAMSACGGVQPSAVSLASLATAPQQYLDEQVATRGVVQRFVDPSGPYYVIEDALLHRVEVLPASDVSADVGRQVEVTGRFSFNPSIGRFINIESISPTNA